jgi:hypothetical protein
MIFIGFREFKIQSHQRISKKKKKIDFGFHPALITIHKKRINNVYVELNYASNGENVIVYFSKSTMLSLMKSQFFRIFKIL